MPRHVHGSWRSLRQLVVIKITVTMEEAARQARELRSSAGGAWRVNTGMIVGKDDTIVARRAFGRDEAVEHIVAHLLRGAQERRAPTTAARRHDAHEIASL